MAYQVPNLIKIYESSISITSDTSTAESGYEAENLIENLEYRCAVSALFA